MQVHPLLAARWSPASFDPSFDITDEVVEVLLEAARWAPSAGNSQPWAFIVGRPGSDPDGRAAPPPRSRRSLDDLIWPGSADI